MFVVGNSLNQSVNTIQVGCNCIWSKCQDTTCGASVQINAQQQKGVHTRYVESTNSPLPRRDTGVGSVGEKLEVEGCSSHTSDSRHIMYVFHPSYVDENDSSGNTFTRTENFCPMMVQDESKILSILRNPGVVCRILQRPDDTQPRAAAEECDEGLRDPEDMSCQMVRGQRHGIL